MMQLLHNLLRIVARHQEAQVVAGGAIADHADVKRLEDAKDLFADAAGFRQLIANQGDQRQIFFPTGIEGLRWLAVWARSDDNPPLVGTWLVPGDSPGISVVKSWDHAGMRATGSHEVIFNHVRVAAEHAVDVWPTDAPPAAQAEPFRLFANRQTALLAAIYDSIAHAAHDWLVRWLAGRVPAGLGHPLSRLPRVQEKVGQIAGLLLVSRSLLEQAAALRFSAIEANLAKVTITDNAIQAVNIALELTGNHGLSRQNPLERHYRNVLCGRVHTPQSDSAWLAAGNFVFQSQG